MAHRPALRVATDHTVHPAAAIAGDAVDRRPEADLRPRGRRGVDQDRVEHGAPRRVEGVDAV